MESGLFCSCLNGSSVVSYLRKDILPQSNGAQGTIFRADPRASGPTQASRVFAVSCSLKLMSSVRRISVVARGVRVVMVPLESRAYYGSASNVALWYDHEWQVLLCLPCDSKPHLIVLTDTVTKEDIYQIRSRTLASRDYPNSRQNTSSGFVSD